MSADTSRPATRPRPLLDRVASVTGVLALTMVALPATALASGGASLASDPIPLALHDLARLGEALGRGELPLEVVGIGALVALALGMALALLVGGLRRRRGRSLVTDGAAAAASDEVVESPPTLSWPAEDGDVFRAAVPARHDVAVDPDQADPLTAQAPRDAAQAEAWAAREATIQAARGSSAWSSGLPPTATAEPQPLEPQPAEPETFVQEPTPSPAPARVFEAASTGAPAPSGASTGAVEAPAVTWSDLPLPYAAIAPSEPTLAPRTDIAPTRSALGTPEAPLVVELHDNRDTTETRHRAPNLPVVAAFATVAVGVAFSAGAAAGAILGPGVGAAIGLAFAGGAGVAVGVIIALLGGRRS